MANPDPAGKSIHQSIPPRRLPPIQRQFVRKTSNPRTFGALKFMARYLRVGPKQKTRRHAFSNQNTAGPSQKRRHVFPTKTRPDQAKRDATFFQPKHGRTKPKETLRFSDQNTGKPSQTKATLEIRQMSVFPGPPEESQRNIADRKPEENQRNVKTSQIQV